MTSKSDGNAEGNGQDWSASDSSTRALPSLSTTSRSVTPKGTLFPNLGVAHQAITSRLVSRTAGQQVPSTSSQPSSSTSFVNVSSLTGSADSQPSNNNIELANLKSPTQRCLTPFFGTSSTSTEWTKTPTDPSPIVSSLASSSASNSVGNSLHNGAAENSAVSDGWEAGEIVQIIYDQYYTPPPQAQSSSLAKAHQSKTIDSYTAPNSNRFKPSEKPVQNMNIPSSDMRHANTDLNLGREVKQPARGLNKGVLNFSRPVLSVRSASSRQDNTNQSVDTSQAGRLEAAPGTSGASDRSHLPASFTGNSSEDFVIYGGLPPQPGHDKPSEQSFQETDIDNGEASNAGVSTDSDEDPFKYDRGSFTIFLQPSKEREVSAALRYVSRDSTASETGLLQLSSSPEPATPRGLEGNNPLANKLQSYQASAGGYDWDPEHGPNEVKISVVRSPPPVPPNTPVQQPMKLGDFVEGLGSQRRRRDVNTLMSDGADWETVADSVGQFDSNRALASSTGLSGSHPVKITGSSIADYSDTSSVHVPQFDAFSSSTDRIVGHPTSGFAPGTRGGRILNDPSRPVFLPKPRIHRVNGYLQNSRRMFTDTTSGSSGNSVRGALVDRLTASIRSRSARKQVYRKNQLNMEPWSRSNFKSLDSVSSTYSEQPGAMDELQAFSSAHGDGTSTTKGYEKQPVHATTFGLLASPIPREPSPVYLKDHKPNQSRQSDQPAPLDSPTLFSFPLISLEEAAQRAAIRASNDDNLTVTSGGRTRKNSSMDSSMATYRTTPPTPHISRPSGAHPRRPTSASIFRISSHHRGDSEYSQDRFIMGHERGISNVTSYKSAIPLVTGHSALSRSFRNPFEPVCGSSLRSSHRTFDSPPRLVPRDKRSAARAAAAAALAGNNNNNMTADLRHIAALEAGASFGAIASDDAYISWEARKRRDLFFCGLCVLATVPFISPLIWLGKFDAALSWFTRGEVGELTYEQKKRVHYIGVAFWVVWAVAVTIIFTVAIQRGIEARWHQ